MVGRPCAVGAGGNRAAPAQSLPAASTTAPTAAAGQAVSSPGSRSHSRRCRHTPGAGGVAGQTPGQWANATARRSRHHGGVDPADTSLDSFSSLAISCGAAPQAAAALHAELVARHAEPHRRYHTLDHVAWVLAALEETGQGLGDRRAVSMAAWWHDAIYDTSAPGSEQRSAARARRSLVDAGCGEVFAARVAQLVAVTEGHAPAGPEAAALCDADLWVLGAEPDSYERYRAGVFYEYVTAGPYTTAQWAVGRARVLESLLERDRLFHTEAGARRESAARANLTGELDTLTG